MEIPNLKLHHSKFVLETDWAASGRSEFDELLVGSWYDKMSSGLFRYTWKIEQEKHIGTNYNFVIQLNPLRSEKRRPPQEIKSVRQPFDPSSFNFTKLKQEEFIFVTTNEDGSKDYIAINDSPIDEGHSLLIPQLGKKLPQLITKEGLQFAIGVLLMSRNPSFRVGFNGLCAFASVNHLHFHAYYFNNQMMLETVNVKLLAGNCYYQDEFPSRGYVFQIRSSSEIKVIIGDIVKLTDYLVNENVAHNLFMTRAIRFNSTQGQFCSKRDCVRIYIWVREASSGGKDVNIQNPALCELFGHFPIYDKQTYEDVTEESLAQLLGDLTDRQFEMTRDSVKALFED